MVAAAVGCAPTPHAEHSQAKAAAATALPATSPKASVPALSAAFALVYPRSTITVTTDGEDDRYAMKPQAIYRISDDTFALVSVGPYVGTAAHIDGGYASVAYLTTRPTLALQGQPLRLKGTMGGFGEPPHVSLLTGVGLTPMLQVETGSYNQGEGDSSVYLLALGPTIRDAVVVVEDIPFSHTQASADGQECDIQGKIVPVVQDKVFEVRYSGDYGGQRRYRRQAGQWTTSASDDLREHCR